MIQLSVQEIAEITSSSCQGNTTQTIKHFYTDSRNIQHTQQSIFIAIQGEQTDGHAFIQELYTKGIRVFWVNQQAKYPQIEGATYIISPDTLEAFQILVAHHRNSFTYPIIGITGSNGKTIVKEWLYHICKPEFAIVKSPRSYNSQIGVPLSVMLLHDSYNLGIFEAGISKTNEMQHLQKIIKPTIGIITNIGDAHEQGFETIQQKAEEKLLLFSQATHIIYRKDYKEIHTAAQSYNNATLHAWSDTDTNADIFVRHTNANKATTIYISFYKKDIRFSIHYTDAASIENAIHCAIATAILGISDAVIKRFETLPPIAMRLEQITGTKNCTIINDSYNSDMQSLTVALQYMWQQNQHTKKTLILSDIKQQLQAHKHTLYNRIAQLIKNYNIGSFVGIGHDMLQYMKPLIPHGHFFISVDDFLQHDISSSFVNQTILLKGAREYAFEKIAKRLEQQSHQTVLEINLNAIIHNLSYFKNLIQPATKIMAMVKAFSYGSGSYEIANVLQHHKVDYLAVAFADEGVELQKAGIRIPIVIMNPERNMMDYIFDHQLQPSIHNWQSLEELELYCTMHPKAMCNVHIKINTGMNRYGFLATEITTVAERLARIAQCKIISIFSHLVGADDAQFDEFTHQQINTFLQCCTEFSQHFTYPIMRHILNSAGVERFSHHQLDMVRIGIGLYGVSATQSKNCMHVSTLKTNISEIRTLEANTTIGYSRKWTVLRNSRVAVIPIGYADGLNRKLSNGIGSVLIHNTPAPIVGNICMDATMIDITDIPAATIGDEVIVFGDKLPISTLAHTLDTIPYEIITSISRRVKRLYYYD